MRKALEYKTTQDGGCNDEDVQWRLKPTPTCGATLDSRNVSSMASCNVWLVRGTGHEPWTILDPPVTASHPQLVPCVKAQNIVIVKEGIERACARTRPHIIYVQHKKRARTGAHDHNRCESNPSISRGTEPVATRPLEMPTLRDPRVHYYSPARRGAISRVRRASNVPPSARKRNNQVYIQTVYGFGAEGRG
jgi:hypothetical protein